MKYVLLIFILLSHLVQSSGRETVRFKAADGLEVTADLYMPHPKSAPLVILFHQANSSRGEYIEIAPRLNSMGYNCLAVDLRSGGSMNDVQNLTSKNAKSTLRETQYVNALADMIAAIDYSRQYLSEGKIILLGSSYSAALALKLTGDMPDEIDAVIAFSPGEYFSAQGKPRDYIASSAINITQPSFITSAKNEKNSWWGIYVSIPSHKKVYFLPEAVGNHGAKALWSKFSDSEDYWKAMHNFLGSI